MRRRAKFIASFFYLGYSPFIPGTVGSLGGLFVYFLVKNNEILYGFTIIFLLALGVLFSGEAEKIYNKKDDRNQRFRNEADRFRLREKFRHRRGQ